MQREMRAVIGDDVVSCLLEWKKVCTGVDRDCHQGMASRCMATWRKGGTLRSRDHESWHRTFPDRRKITPLFTCGMTYCQQKLLPLICHLWDAVYIWPNYKHLCIWLLIWCLVARREGGVVAQWLSCWKCWKPGLIPHVMGRPLNTVVRGLVLHSRLLDLNCDVHLSVSACTGLDNCWFCSFIPPRYYTAVKWT